MTIGNPRAVGDPRVSLTAYATAGAWACYRFPEADRFNNARTRAAFVGARAFTGALSPLVPALGGFGRQLYWRHRWMGERIAAHAPSLAIEIGAGLSSRGLAHARAHAEMQWIDLDLADIVMARRALLAGHVLPTNYRLEAGDLLDPAFAATLNAPVGGAISIITEGVVDYLNIAEKTRVWRTVAALLQRLGGGRYLCDINPLSQMRPRGRRLLAALARRVPRLPPPPVFETADQALGLLRDCGFHQARVLGQSELSGGAAAPTEGQRIFTLMEAEIAATDHGR